MERILIKTDSYAGNFERELTAWVTGIVGIDDNTGEEMVEDWVESQFESYVDQKSTDDYGTFRPCDLDDKNPNNVIIFLCESLPDHLKQLVYERAKSFNENFVLRNNFYKQRPEQWNGFELLGIDF